MKKVLYLVLGVFSLVETSFAMKQKELSRIQLDSRRAVSKLIEGRSEWRSNSDRCKTSISALIRRLQESGDESGASVLTLTELRSIIYIIEKLSAYRERSTPILKEELLSVADSYGNSVSELIHSMVD